MKIWFPIKVYQKMRAYVNNTKLEISGLGRVERRGEDFWITDVKILEQRVTGTETVLDRRAIGKFYDEIMQEGGATEEWKLWWHSHNNMEAFFSKTDVDTIDDFDTEEEANNWWLSIVTNHEGKIKNRVDIYRPIRCNIADLDWDISFDDSELDDEIKLEISEKVTEPPVKPKAPQQPPQDTLIPDIYDDEQYYSEMYGMNNTGDGGDTKDQWKEYLRKTQGKKNGLLKPGNRTHKRIHRPSTIKPLLKKDDTIVEVKPEIPESQEVFP